MIDTAFVFSAEAQVQRCNTQVVDESRIIGPRAERRDAQIRTLARFLTILLLGSWGGGRCALDAACLQPLPNAETGLGVLHVASHAIDELFERVGARHVQE